MTPAITIVGLGPGPAELRTIAAQNALDNTTHIFVRSHGDIDLDTLLQQPNVTDLQAFNEQDAANRWLKAAEVVLASAKVDPVVLAIPGHPRFGEGLVTTVLHLAAEQGLITRVIDGISATDMLASALDLDPIHDRVQLLAGWALRRFEKEAPFDGGLLGINPHQPVLVTHLYDSAALQATQQQLARVFPADHPVELISAAGLSTESRSPSVIGNLANEQGDWLLAVFVPGLPELDATRSADTLQHTMALLRREDGCPWDRKQTNQSLSAALADEVYEVIDAINAEDDANLCEELGDLLMLIVMHAQIAEERGAFALEEVYHAINTKIVRRHPHVFGDLAAANADEVVGLWQEVKRQERADAPAKPEKAADGQPHSMPTLDRAVRVLKKHPLAAIDSTEDIRQQALLQAVAAIVVAGDDPKEVLKQALIDHVSARKDAE